jgi:hypothetical protein
VSSEKSPKSSHPRFFKSQIKELPIHADERRSIQKSNHRNTMRTALGASYHCWRVTCSRNLLAGPGFSQRNG